MRHALREHAKSGFKHRGNQVITTYQDISMEIPAEYQLKEDLEAYGEDYKIVSTMYDGYKIIVVWEVK